MLPQTQLELPPDAVVLIALLHPHDGDGAAPAESASQLDVSSAAAFSPDDPQQGTLGQAAAPHQSPEPSVAGSSSAVGAMPDSTASDMSSADSAADAAANGIAAPSSVAEGSHEEREEQAGEAPKDGEPVLVGTFELAFTEAARTKELTLNPPNVRPRTDVASMPLMASNMAYRVSANCERASDARLGAQRREASTT